MTVVSAVYIAKRLGVVPSAVSNWSRRGVLPAELLPVDQVDHGTPYPTSVWDESQVPLFVTWYESRRP